MRKMHICNTSSSLLSNCVVYFVACTPKGTCQDAVTSNTKINSVAVILLPNSLSSDYSKGGTFCQRY